MVQEAFPQEASRSCWAYRVRQLDKGFLGSAIQLHGLPPVVFGPVIIPAFQADMAGVEGKADFQGIHMGRPFQAFTSHVRILQMGGRKPLQMPEGCSVSGRLRKLFQEGRQGVGSIRSAASGSLEFPRREEDVMMNLIVFCQGFA